MSKSRLLVLSFLLLAGCKAPSEARPPLVVDDMSVLAPTTLPFATVLSPGASADAVRVSHAEKRILETTADWDAFVAEHPDASPLLARPDLAKRTVVAFAEPDLYRSGSARIVGVEEQSTRLLVHTVRWQTMPDTAPPYGVLHLVALPRSSKPIVFAQTQTIALTRPPVAPSPAVGQQPLSVPATDGLAEFPRWRLVPNPDVTLETVEADIRAQLGPDRLQTLHVEKQSLEWVNKHLDMDGPTAFLPESEVWVAIATGKFEIQIPQSGKPSLGAPVRTVTMLLSIEDGRPFTTVWR